MRFNVIVAVCENFGIGTKGALPWNLKSELKYFSKTTKHVNDSSKKNAIIMGRKTYFGIPEHVRPLPGRLNIILSTTLNQSDLPECVLLFPDLESAMKHLQQHNVKLNIENVWIIGGSGVYKEALVSNFCHRLYMTKIKGTFDCDTFFPNIPDSFHEVPLDSGIPSGIQDENGIQYEYKIYENKKCSTH